MTSDDQHFLDLLSTIPTDVKRTSLQLADSIDRHFESVAVMIREVLSSSDWLPESARPLPPPRVPAPPSPPLGYYERVQDWALRNKSLTAIALISLGATGYLIYRRRKTYGRKRRARRASNGARREVVVISGSPNDPITRTLSLDLERRGFIVYVVVGTVEEEQIVHNESRVDIRPLNVDVTDPTSAIEHFSRILLSPQHAFPGAPPHNLNLAGVIVIPDITYPSGPIETTSPAVWSDLLNVRILSTIATTQAFLRTICEFKARVLMLTPAAIPALSPPFHAPESTIVAALSAFTSCLASELATMGIPVAHFKLGAFDCGAVGGRHHLQQSPSNATRADVLAWSATARAAYARNFVAQAQRAGSRSCLLSGGGEGAPRGSPLRELHNAVFDALTVKKPQRVWRVGSGSLVYDIVGRWAPAGIVGWMLGIRRVNGVGDDAMLGEDGWNGSGVTAQSAEWEKV
ncbi:hypothetical protein FGG08_001360 [Glutinoglossum americanum]|uniref:DUF1776-domain-containing protein n=1 Tax=Glutinoglossum americanum TaxID=1670608 RepID=A0A9P8IGW6_9PEZI|nr:hypothetical protein FGG08_001360 [Glutinoglossum americanum]